MIYGYARISTPKQNIERQVRNILRYFPDAIIIREVYTGTKMSGRKKMNNLLKTIRPGDTIIFDAVPRMSRNADEGVALYKELYERGINLIFLNNHHIDTDTYKSAVNSKMVELNISTNDEATDELISSILKSINDYILKLAAKQIRLAFEQAEQEVSELHRRTSEGIETARLSGKQIGQRKGAKLTTKKSITSKEIIIKHSKDFLGTLSDKDVITLTGLSRNTYYKYKRELSEE
ncbi:MAG: recombinase family protein [Ruminococcus sp.]|nr:recombinase family protein [Ruminococcus sp.]